MLYINLQSKIKFAPYLHYGIIYQMKIDKHENCRDNRVTQQLFIVLFCLFVSLGFPNAELQNNRDLFHTDVSEIDSI